MAPVLSDQRAPTASPASTAFWSERENAEDTLAAKLQGGILTNDEAGQLRSWIANGHITVRAALPREVVDELLVDAQRWAAITNFGNRVRDLYFFSQAARRTVFSPKVTRFISLAFEGDILAFESSLADRMPEGENCQGPSPYPPVPAVGVIASWIALEDTPGGVWTKGDAILSSGHSQHSALNTEFFRSLISRRHISTFYCPYDAVPAYFATSPSHRAKIRWSDACYYSSGCYLASDQIADSMGHIGRASRLWQYLQEIKPVVKPFIPPPLRSLLRIFVPKDLI